MCVVCVHVVCVCVCGVCVCGVCDSKVLIIVNYILLPVKFVECVCVGGGGWKCFVSLSK